MNDAVVTAIITALGGIITAVIVAYFGYRTEQRRLEIERERLKIESQKLELEQQKRRANNKKAEAEKKKEDASPKDIVEHVRPRTNWKSRFLTAFWKLPVFFALVVGGAITYSIFSFASQPPLCQPPIIVVTAIDENGEAESISPGGTFGATFASSAILKADTLNATAIACEWEYAGNAIFLLERRNGCTIRVTFSQQPGESGVVVLSAMDSRCSQKSIFSFNVEVK